MPYSSLISDVEDQRLAKGIRNLFEQDDVDEALNDIYIEYHCGAGLRDQLTSDLLAYRTGHEVNVAHMLGLFEYALGMDALLIIRPTDYDSAHKFVFDVMNAYNIFRDDDSEQLMDMWKKLLNDIADVLNSKPKITLKVKTPAMAA